MWREHLQLAVRSMGVVRQAQPMKNGGVLHLGARRHRSLLDCVANNTPPSPYASRSVAARPPLGTADASSTVGTVLASPLAASPMLGCEGCVSSDCFFCFGGFGLRNNNNMHIREMVFDGCRMRNRPFASQPACTNPFSHHPIVFFISYAFNRTFPVDMAERSSQSAPHEAATQMLRRGDYA